MSEGHLSNNDFFVRLSELFDQRRTRNHGSVFLTQKRMTYGEDREAAAIESTTAQTFPDLNPSKPRPIIVRAHNGKSKDNRSNKIKLSTIVEADVVEGFFARYAEICKLGMSGLKKRDRSKAKEKLKAKKKKLGGGAAATDGKRT